MSSNSEFEKQINRFISDNIETNDSEEMVAFMTRHPKSLGMLITVVDTIKRCLALPDETKMRLCIHNSTMRFSPEQEPYEVTTAELIINTKTSMAEWILTPQLNMKNLLEDAIYTSFKSEFDDTLPFIDFTIKFDNDETNFEPAVFKNIEDVPSQKNEPRITEKKSFREILFDIVMSPLKKGKKK